MKKFRKIMAVLVAAMMVVAMAVPAWAAGGASDKGRITDTGSITLTGDDLDLANQTYMAYKMLDLASFRDGIYEGTTTENNDNALLEDNHKSDAYAYVISTKSPWLPFVRGAVLTKGATSADDVKYFEVSPDADYIELLGTTDPDDSTKLGRYLVVKPTSGFSNGFANGHETGGNIDEVDNTEYTTANAAQRLAQAAIYYACGDGVSDYPNLTTIQEVYSGSPYTGKITTAPYAKQLTAATTSGLDLGYYVVSTTSGTLCSLDTTNKSVKIKEKNKKPTIEKLVQEDEKLAFVQGSDATAAAGDAVSAYRAVNDADEGDYIYYRTKINVEKGAENYVLRDEMAPGLTYDKTYGVKVFFLQPAAQETTTSKANEAHWIELADKVRLTLTRQTDQTIVTYPSISDRATDDVIVLSDYFTVDDTDPIYTKGASAAENVIGDVNVEFNQKFLTFLSDQMGTGATNTNYRLVVVYRAVLNENAVPDSETANANNVKLTYGEKDVPTAVSTTYTATWSFDLYKYTNEDSRGALTGAHFQIFKDKDGETPLRFVRTDDGKYRYDSRIQGSDWTIPAHTSDVENIETKLGTNLDTNTANGWTVVDTITTKADGTLNVKGLDGDTYYLKETLAPKGYNQIAGLQAFHILSVYEANEGKDETTVQIMKSATVQTKDNSKAGNVYLRDFSSTPTAVTDREFPNLANERSTGIYKKISVLNTTSKELPSTGGAGTTVLYIVGGMLVILAGAYLFFSKRRQA